MGWNAGWEMMETAVMAVFNAGALTSTLLRELARPYRGTDIDCGGYIGIETNDGRDIFDVICMTMRPQEYNRIMAIADEDKRIEEQSELYFEIANGDFGWE